MSRFLHRPGRRALRVGALTLAVVSFAAMSQALPARADDERDAAANAAAEAEATVNALQSQLEGIDASLAQVFIDLQALNGQIPVAQAAYETATATYDAKSREHATILGELSAAQGEQNRIDQSLTQATTQADDAQRAIADLVRRKYREGNVDPVAVALTAGGTESITDRAAAADMALRTESQTMTAALDVSSSQRTQATRQNAITDRIADLEVKAAQAEAEAKVAKNDADAKLTELNKLKEQAAQFEPYHASAGLVITSADASADQVEPAKSRLVLIFTVVGIFAGLVMMLLRETRARSLDSATQLADLTALPVWSAEHGTPEPWLAPTRMLAMAIDRDHWVDLITDASDPEARQLHRVLSRSLAETRVPAPRLIDIYQPLASLLDEVRPSRHVLIAVRKGHDLKKLHGLLDELALINREVNGMLYLESKVSASAADTDEDGSGFEVIEPDDALKHPADPDETQNMAAYPADNRPDKATEMTTVHKKIDSTEAKDQK